MTKYADLLADVAENKDRIEAANKHLGVGRFESCESMLMRSEASNNGSTSSYS
jgi:hypothetical protein